MKTAFIIVEYVFVSPLLFTLPLQDMCVVCGSFGKGAEGQLLACAQCAQCYHPYCVNSKVNVFVPSLCFYNSLFFFFLVKKRALISTFFADHQDEAPQGLALLGMHRLRSVWEGVGPLPASAVRRLRRQLSHLLPGPSSAQRPKGRLEVQMVQIFHF